MRDIKDYAIEHAGYLADTVERVLQDNRVILDDETYLTLTILIYEFRKRAKQAGARMTEKKLSGTQ